MCENPLSIIMEYLEKGSLYDHLRKINSMQPETMSVRYCQRNASLGKKYEK
jgi:hypothetical protein